MAISFGKKFDPNPNVTLSKNGTKLVTVYDNRTEYSRTFRVSDQEADEFVLNRKKAIKRAKIRNVFLCLLGGVVGGAIGHAKAAGNHVVTGIAALAGLASGELLGALIGSSNKAGLKITEKFIDKNLENVNV